MKTTSKKNLERLKVCKNLAPNSGDEHQLLSRTAAGNSYRYIDLVFGSP